MNATHRRLATVSAILLLSAAFLGARAEDAGADHPRDAADTAIALRNHQVVPSSHVGSPARSAAPALRTLDPEETVSGSEPDPENFDRRGLEKWWQHFQKTMQKAN